MAMPPDESAIYHCLWLTEFYTPSEADEMLRRLEKMRSSMRGAAMHDFAKFARDMREHPYGGGWNNIGYLVPRGSRRSFIGPDRLVTDLPAGVTHAPASVMSITPSLSALVIQFVFDDSVTEEWLAPLGRTHRRRRVRKGGVIHYLGPRQDKSSEAADARRAIRTRCAAWIDRHVPGYFSGLPGSGNHPVIEFITLRKAKPLGDRGRLDDYLWALDLYESFETWVIDGYLRLRQGGLIEKDPRVATLAAREDELHAAGRWKHTGHGWNRQAVLISLGVNEFDQFAAKFAIGSLLRSYEAALARTRDRLIDSRHGSADATLKLLEQQLAGLSRGIQSIGPELTRLLDGPWFRRDLGTITWQYEMPEGTSDPTSLWIDSLRERAQQLSVSERSVRELLVASAQVAAAREGIRLQRGARLIAILGVVIAILGLVIALASLAAQA